MQNLFSVIEKLCTCESLPFLFLLAASLRLCAVGDITGLVNRTFPWERWRLSMMLAILDTAIRRGTKHKEISEEND
jgi:hypothetical protein